MSSISQLQIWQIKADIENDSNNCSSVMVTNIQWIMLSLNTVHHLHVSLLDLCGKKNENQNLELPSIHAHFLNSTSCISSHTLSDLSKDILVTRFQNNLPVYSVGFSCLSTNVLWFENMTTTSKMQILICSPSDLRVEGIGSNATLVVLIPGHLDVAFLSPKNAQAIQIH